jgi:uncharacterized protein YcfJ
MSSKKVLVSAVAAVLAFSGVSAFAGQGPYDGRQDDRYDRRDNDGYDGGRYDSRDGNGAEYDYARVVDVEPLTRRIRVSEPRRECWNETRVDNGPYNNGPDRNRGVSTVIGAVIGGVLGSQVGHGRGRDAATVAGAVIGGAVGRDQAQKRAAQRGYGGQPSREYTVERCEVRHVDSYEERTDGYRVTYVYNGRKGVTELPYRPGDSIRVRVDVTPAE